MPLLPTASLGSSGATASATGPSTSTMCARSAAAVALRERVGVDELGGERADAEGLARRPLQAAGVADHDLEAAAAEVEAQRGRGLEQHAGADGAGR